MEQKLAKKVWKLVRVVYLMLRKGISKRKLMLDLNMIIKRGKLAGKALQNLMFNHHHVHNSVNRLSSPPPSEFDEFSCTTSPVAYVMMAMETVSPVVRQLRVTDSPFPLGGVDEDSRVDEEAEQFINRFYNDLRRQNTKAALG